VSATERMDPKKRTLAFIAAIDPAELAVRIIEASGGVKRPPGKTAKQALDDLPDEDRTAALNAARAAAEYLTECVNAGQRPA
jgi:hypothetical protein